MANRDEWANRVRQWRASGLTAGEFATREGINANTLKWWSSRLRGAGEAKFIDVTALVTPPQVPALEVVVRGSVSLRVQPGFDAALLRAVVSALESR
jgi:hypothetical protein